MTRPKLSSLLFLLPPSCMVAPIGKLANKSLFSSTIFSNSTTDSKLKKLLPTMSTELNIGMDFQQGHAPTNKSEVRGRNPLSPNISSRELSMVSSGQSTPYHDRMDIEEDNVPPSNHSTYQRPELSYETEQEKAMRLGKATNLPDNTRPLATNNEATPAHVAHEEDAINIQLPYDPNAPTDPEL